MPKSLHRDWSSWETSVKYAFYYNKDGTRFFGVSTFPWPHEREEFSPTTIGKHTSFDILWKEIYAQRTV